MPSLWRPDELRYVEDKLVCHCVDALYTATHAYSTQAHSRGRGFYACGAPTRSCKFWRWSGNDLGGPPPAPNQPLDTPTVAPNPPDSPSKRSLAPPSNQDTMMTSPGPSQNVRVGRKELEDYVFVLEKRLADKDEELRVALRWKNEVETKLEDTKDRLKDLLESLD